MQSRYVEKPFWRGDGEPGTSAMVDEICIYLQRFEALEKSERSWAESYSQKKALGQFLFQVNIIEGEGFDTLEETQEALRELNESTLDTSSKLSDERLEQVRCLRRALGTWWDEEQPDSVPSISNYKLLSSHDVLMASTQPAIAGVFRSSSELASTITTSGKIHYFTSPSSIKPKLSSLFTRTNSELQKVFGLGDRRKMVEQLLVAAGEFFYKFECVHPFADGNGRCGRIMLAYLLRKISFVPNVLFSGPVGEFVDRDVYLSCFERARELDDNEPRELTALVIEGVYLGWKKLFAELETWREFVEVEVVEKITSLELED